MLPRRTLAFALSAISLFMVSAGAAEQERAARAEARPVPLVYMTDLYQPYCDPDDLWDLATVYALAKQKRVRLLGIVLDSPLPPDRNGWVLWGAGDPAIVTIAQMNTVTDLPVPAVVGSSVSFGDVVHGGVPLAGPDRASVDFVLRTLRDSPEPVAITVVGSCRNVALAACEDRELFAEKCRGIHLNVDTVRRHPGKPGYEGWNKALDPEAYLSLWTLPCPIYWLPCFEDPSRFEVCQFGTFWYFRQGDILAHLAPQVQNCLLYGLTRDTNLNWLSQLRGTVDKSALERQGNFYRSMWCTAGLFHLGGLSVSREGQLMDMDDVPPEDALFALRPISSVDLNASGAERWDRSPPGAKRYVIQISDPKAYVEGMRQALRTLLESL